MKIKFKKHGLIFKKSHKNIIGQFKKYIESWEHFDEDLTIYGGIFSMRNKKLKWKVYRQYYSDNLYNMISDNIALSLNRPIEKRELLMHLKEKYEN